MNLQCELKKAKERLDGLIEKKEFYESEIEYVNQEIQELQNVIIDDLQKEDKK